MAESKARSHCSVCFVAYTAVYSELCSVMDRINDRLTPKCPSQSERDDGKWMRVLNRHTHASQCNWLESRSTQKQNLHNMPICPLGSKIVFDDEWTINKRQQNIFYSVAVGSKEQHIEKNE